ncbi:MAG: hypothetical protein LC769_00295 [Chloroflexi bacterium]|nr:hypothetical protein [Chloroflexota bacterium]
MRSGIVVRIVTLRAQGQGYGTGPPVFDGATHRILIASPGGVNILDARSGRLVNFTRIANGDPDKIVVDSHTHKAYVTLLNSPALGCPTGYHTCTRTVGAYVVIDDRDGRLLSPRIMIPGTTAIGAIGLSSRMNRLFVGDYGIYGSTRYGAIRDDRVYVVDVRTGRMLNPIVTDGHPTTIVVEDSAGMMVAGGPNGIEAVDTRTGSLLQRVPLPVEKIWAVDGRGDLVVSNDTYSADTTETGRGPFDRIAALFRTITATAGIYRHVNSGVSIVRIGAHHS